MRCGYRRRSPRPLRSCPSPLQGAPQLVGSTSLKLRPLDYIKFFETQGRAEIQAELPYLEALLNEMKDKTSDEWAHRDCISEHVCFTDTGRALVRRLESPEEKAKRLPGDGPKPTPEGYTWGKVGKHVWGNPQPGQSYGI